MRSLVLTLALFFGATSANAQEFPGFEAWRYGDGVRRDQSRRVIVVAPQAARLVGQATVAAIDIGVLGSQPGFRLRIPGIQLNSRARLGLTGRGGLGFTNSGAGPTLGGGLRLELNAWQDAEGNEALMVSASAEAFQMFGRAFDADSFWGPPPPRGVSAHFGMRF